MFFNYKAKLSLKENISCNLVRYQFKLVEPQEIEFKSGQFLSIVLPNNKGMRSYSISSSEIHKDFVEITVNIDDRSLGGAGVDYLGSLQMDDEIQFRGPFGIFTLEGTGALNGENEIIWIATGSGIAPIKSMIERYNIIEKKQKNILYFGLRHEEEICHKELFDSLKSEFNHFDYKLCLSRPKDSWTGYTGYVTENILNDYKNLDKSNMKAYICGKTSTVQSIFKSLGENGFTRTNLHFENFG